MKALPDSHSESLKIAILSNQHRDRVATFDDVATQASVFDAVQLWSRVQTGD